MQTVTELLSESKRKVVYLVYGFIGVGLGATQTAFTTAEAITPLWLTVALAVYLYIGGAFGLVAAQNVGSQEVIVSPYNGDEAVEDIEIEEPMLGKHGELEDDAVYDAEPEVPDFSVSNE